MYAVLDMRELGPSNGKNEDGKVQTPLHQLSEIHPIPPVWSYVRGVSLAIAGTIFIACDEEYVGMLLIGSGLLMIVYHNNQPKIK